VSRQSNFAIAGAITCFTLAANSLYQYSCAAQTETAKVINAVKATAASQPVGLPVFREDEITDDKLPGGEAVGKVLRRIQDELDHRSLTKASRDELEELAGKYPTNYKVHLYMGLMLDDLGLPDQAMAEYEQADKLGPNDPRATAGIMNHILARRDARGASELLDKSLKRFPNSPEILFFMGKNFKEGKHWFEATRILNRAYNSGYKIKHLAAELAEMYQESDPPKALKLANEDLAQYPDYHLALQVKAIALMNMGQFAQAVEPLRKLYNQSPSFSRSAEYYLRCLYWTGQFKEAVQPAFYFLGKEAQYVGGPLVSVEVLNNVLKSQSETHTETELNQFYARLAKDKLKVKPAFHYYLGSIFYQLGRPHLAKSELQQYLAEDPQSIDGLYLYGRLEENYAHNYKEALRVYEIAHALSPYNIEVGGAYTRMEEKLSMQSSDWAGSVRDWLSRIFNPGLD